MVIQTIVMQYADGQNAMMGLTFNEKALHNWVKSLHISNTMEKKLPDLKETSTSKDVSHHNEERHSKIIEDKKDREKIRNFLSTCVQSFDTENHPAEIANIHTGKLSN